MRKWLSVLVLFLLQQVAVQASILNIWNTTEKIFAESDFVKSEILVNTPDSKSITYNSTSDFMCIESLYGNGISKDSIVGGGKPNAEIAQEFKKDVGVELSSEFDDILAKARGKLDDRAYWRTLEFFQKNFSEKDPKTGGDLFSAEEKQYLFGIAMELLAIGPTRPNVSQLKTTLQKRWDECLSYYTMWKEAYILMGDFTKASIEINKLNALSIKQQQILAELWEKKAELWEKKAELDKEIINSLSAFYDDCLAINNPQMQHKFYSTVEGVREWYLRGNEEPPQWIEKIRWKIQERK